MHKQTKHNKRIKRKNKTLKHYGGATTQIVNNGTSGVANSANDKESIFRVIGNKLSEKAKPAFEYAKEKGLRLLGLQSIKNTDDVLPETTSNIDNKINELDNTTSEFLSNAKEIGADAVKIANAGTAAIIANINDVLQNPEVGKSVIETAKETAEIGEKLLENFNDNLSTPKMKEEVKQAVDNAADYIEIVAEATDEPANKLIDKLNDAGTKIASDSVSGAVKVGATALSAIPFLGAVLDTGIIANTVANTVGNISETVSNVSETASEVTKEINENVGEGIVQLNKEKKMGGQIENRTNESIQQFQNPLYNATPKSVLRGGKTRRKQFKRNIKSKRVRFAI